MKRWCVWAASVVLSACPQQVKGWDAGAVPAATDSGRPQRDASVQAPDGEHFVAATIEPDGGTIELPGFATAAFPPVSFEAPRRVRLARTHRPDTEALWSWSSLMWEAGKRDRDELRLETGASAPSAAVVVELEVPRAVGLADEVKLFARVLEGSEYETLIRFIPLGAERLGPHHLRAVLEPTHFRQDWPDDGGAPFGPYEAVLILTAAP